MSLNHNQMAYAAIISTLIFGSLFVGISGFYQTSSGVGDFDSAAEENITPDLEISSGDALDSDYDGLPDVLETSQSFLCKACGTELTVKLQSVVANEPPKHCKEEMTPVEN